MDIKIEKPLSIKFKYILAYIGSVLFGLSHDISVKYIEVHGNVTKKECHEA